MAENSSIIIIIVLLQEISLDLLKIALTRFENNFKNVIRSGPKLFFLVPVQTSQIYLIYTKVRIQPSPA